MEALVILAIPVALVVGLIWLLVKFLIAAKGNHDLRTVLTEVGFGLAIISGFVLCGYLIRLASLKQETLQGSHEFGIVVLTKWGHWGVWSSEASAVCGVFGRGKTRFFSIVAAALFAAFWIVVYAGY